MYAKESEAKQVGEHLVQQTIEYSWFEESPSKTSISEADIEVLENKILMLGNEINTLTSSQ